MSEKEVKNPKESKASSILRVQVSAIAEYKGILAAVNKAKTVTISHPGNTIGKPRTIKATKMDPTYPKYSGYFLLKRRQVAKSRNHLYTSSIPLVSDTTNRNTVIKKPS